MVVFVVGRVLENRREELKVLERDVTKLEAIQAPFPRMSYDDAVKKLQAKGSEIQWGGDFGGTDETLLTEDFDRPLMVDRYPTAIKAFYFAARSGAARSGAGRGCARARRLRRNHRRRPAHSRSGSAAEAHRRAPPAAEAFDWYIDLRKYGTVPHGGFGMGIERCVAWMCGLEHIRETIAFPRMLYRLKP